MRLTGKVALVTGGGSGIGRATVVQFAREGARVVILDQDRTGAEAAARAVADAGGTVRVIEGDVAVASDAERAVRETRAAFGRLDALLVNNAGRESSRPFPRRPRRTGTASSTSTSRASSCCRAPRSP